VHYHSHFSIQEASVILHLLKNPSSIFSILGFKYIALGDVLILLTFGPITVVYSYMAQAGHHSIYPILYALPLTLNTEAILHSNNTRDMEHDRSVGILTLSILLGKRYSYYLYCLLIYSPYLIISYIMINISWYFCLPLLTIFYAYRLCEEFKHDQLIRLPNRTAILNFLLGFLYIISIIITNTARKKQQFLF
jgi:1,4-dihydroxy-2-naphthoate octaprenyltransferase